MGDTNKQIVAVISETHSEYHKPILTHLSRYLADAGFGMLCVSASIVRAVVALGKSLDFLTVAEGVENEAQLNFLKLLGCDEAQGYFYSPPLNVIAATDWLRRDQMNTMLKLTGS